MRDRPILFSKPMVLAILSGQKTQTRRIWKMPKGMAWYTSGSLLGEASGDICDIGGRGWWSIDEVRCPYGQVGDRLWVKETHFINDFRGARIPECERSDIELVYRATDQSYVDNLEDDEGFAWRPSIFMPRWASRITLAISGVRVERLQDISEADAIAEGTPGGHGAIPDYPYSATPIEHYRWLWEQINGAGSWNADPWVWVIEFNQVENNN